MATLEQIRAATKKVYPSSVHRGCFDLSPPVRMVNKISDENVAAWLLDEQAETVRFVGCTGCYSIDDYEVSPLQGRIIPEGITEKMLDELEAFFNSVANEREADDGPGCSPTPNARKARDLLDVWFMTRDKPAGLR
jgi:hypothetical protein